MVLESGISRSVMKENIIDHLCCSVECALSKGENFESALHKSLKALAPNGLKEIEFETIILLYPKIIIMKKLTYISGLLFSMMASVGYIFRILHLPGASELTILGFGGLTAVFAPLLIIIRHKAWKSRFDGAREGLLIASIIFITVGFCLRIMQLPGSDNTLLLGLISFTVGFLPMAFLKMYRESIAS